LKSLERNMKKPLKVITSSVLFLLNLLSSNPDKKIGGQAVIEGVMMRSPLAWAVVVRDDKGQLHTYKEKINRGSLIAKIPFIRGSYILWDSLKLGMKALRFSADVAISEHHNKDSSPVWFALSAVVAIILAMGLFVFMPLYLTRIASQFFYKLKENAILFNAFDGLIRVFFFFLYIVGIGLWQEMRKLYQYHGAEHKVLNGFEQKAPFQIDALKSYSRFHPRCGTSFLLVVMVISIVVFSFIPHTWPFYAKFLSRIILIPVVAGISYEFIKLSTKRYLRFLAVPGLVLQSLTTREPEDNQIEVALISLQEVL